MAIEGNRPLTRPTGTCYGPEIRPFPQGVPMRITFEADKPPVLSCGQLTRDGNCGAATDSLTECFVRRGLNLEQEQPARKIIHTVAGDIDYDPENGIVYDWPKKRKLDTQITLTGRQNRLLRVLTDSPGELVTHRTIIDTVWPEGGIDERNALDSKIPTLIGDLKRLLKLQDFVRSSRRVKVIESVRKIVEGTAPRVGGYRLNIKPS